ncbi:glutathione-dependent formaldehyde-activating enzyme [Colletotrichum cereale]|nr:glutathione-dependent formaldehyde-activating enzyme [Colletotrichum cereale]
MSDATSPLIDGSCLCGAVKYTVAGGHGFTVLCHCNSCRKFTGSSFGANSLVDRKSLTVQDPASKISMYSAKTADSGDTLVRSFCSVCGSSLFAATHEFSDKVAVTSGTMNGVQGVKGDKLWAPKLEFFCKRKATWLATEGTVQKDTM